MTTYEGKDYIFHKCIEYLEKLDYPRSQYDIVIVDNTVSMRYFAKLKRKGYKNLYRVERGSSSREALAKSQNKLRRLCIEGGYDYFLSVESDLIVPPDSLKRLLAYGKPVVGSTYNIARDDKFIPCIFINYQTDSGFLGTRPLGVQHQGTQKVYDPSEIKRFFEDRTPLRRVHGCGLGLTLIRRDIVERFPFWTDIRFEDKHSDVYFYLDLQNNNIPVYVDTTVVVPHYPSDWSKVADR